MKSRREMHVTHQSKACGVSEDLVQHHVGGCNPRDPIEVCEALCDPPREPVPDEAPKKHKEEVPISPDLPAVRLGWVRRSVVVQGIHQRGVGQGLGPDHSSRPDQEPPNNTGHAETKALGGNHKQHLKAPAEILLVEDLLRQQDVGRVGYTSLDGNIGHHDNNRVFLDVERTRVEVPFDPKGGEFVVG